MYGGVMMRLAICVNEQTATVVAIVPREEAKIRRDLHGWAQPGVRS
jgi:hypothetical protein